MNTLPVRRRARRRTVLATVIAASWALCLSSIRSAPVEAFTDSDGDTYQVTLSGPGTVAVTVADAGTRTGAIQQLELTGTTIATVLEISVTQSAGGDGTVAIGALNGEGSLRSLIAPHSPLTGSLSLGGGLSSLMIGDIATGAKITVGTAPKAGAMRIISGRIGNATIQCAGTLGALTATAVEGATISAAALGALKTTRGNFDAIVTTPGKLVSLRVEGGDLSGRISAQSIGPIAVRKSVAGAGGSIVDATIAATNSIGAITVAGEVRDSLILAGADLGADGVLGGSGEDSDSFAAGKIGRVKVNGNLSGSILGAGLSPFDGVFKDDNDGIFAGKRSRITALLFGGVSEDSRIGAGELGSVKIGGRRLKLPQLDPRFVTRRLSGTPPPPDPAKNAPRNDPTVPTNLANATAFLYTGANAIQTGVAPGTIEPVRAAVVRGKVLDRVGAPLGAVTINILDHPEFGETMSRADGMFDLAVNGGGLMSVRYEKDGFFAVQRQLEVPPQDYTIAPEVALSGVDPAVTPVAFGAGTPMQIHEGTMQTDADGQRHVALLFTPDTSAALVMADGTTEPMSSLKVRATEYSVGPMGPAAMPALLPATSAYTYCVELTADEADATSAASVRFDKPVWMCVENFLGFEIGIDVPSGFFDRKMGQWVPGPSGRVIKIVSITGGAADFDVTGDGNADSGATLIALGITDMERQELATKYAVGQSLWRVPIPHFSPWDCNWSSGPPADAKAPEQPPPKPDKKPDDPDDPPNVYIQDQVLGESIPVTGTPFTLHYRSDRIPGRTAANQVRIALSDATLPASVKRIELEVNVAGRTFLQDFPAATDQSTTFEWDRLDAYGRHVLGRQAAKIRIGYVYDGTYMQTARFGYNGNGIPITADRTRKEVTFSTNYTTRIGDLDIRRQSIGGWTLDVHHFYDPNDRVLYLGDGSRRSVQTVNNVITTVAGTGLGGFFGSDPGDGGPARKANLNTIYSGIAVGPDGSLYFGDSYRLSMRKIEPSGTIRTVAGGFSNLGDYSGDGGPASKARVSVEGIAVASDGSIVFTDLSGHVRRINPSGIIQTIAGNGSGIPSGDGVPPLTVIAPEGGLASAADGTIYLTQGSVFPYETNAVLAIATDYTISRVAGQPYGTVAGFSGDGGPAIQSTLHRPTKAASGPDGSVYVIDSANKRIRRITPSGIISTFAGDGTDGHTGDGGPATAAKLHLGLFSPIAVARDGTVYFGDGLRVRQVTPDGIITTLAGNDRLGDQGAFLGDGGPPTQAELSEVDGLAIGLDGFYIADAGRIRRVTPSLPGFTGTDIAIPSEDGSQLFHFDSTGRHLSTANTFTGATLFTFDYNTDGQLVKITDASGDVTTIERNTGGQPTGLFAPFGQRTILTTDGNGSLATVQDPLGGTYGYTYTADGLLVGRTDPVGNTSAYTYDSGGRLTKSATAGAAFTALARAEIANGYFVTLDSALGVSDKYRLETTSSGDELRTNTRASNVSNAEVRRGNGTLTFTHPDGAVEEVRQEADPRFGMQTPIEASRRLTTPSGKTLEFLEERTVTLGEPQNPLSLQSFTIRRRVNGAPFTGSYDGTTRTFTVATPLDRKVIVQMDAQGRTEAMQVGNLAAFTFARDDRGRLTGFATGTGSDRRSFQYAYNPAGLRATFTDALNRVQHYSYDAATRLTSQTKADGSVIRFGYDDAGRLASITPPGRSPYLFTYDPDGRLASYTAPDAGSGAATTTSTFNQDRKPLGINRPNGVNVVFGYDAAGRLSSRTAGSSTTAFAYNAVSGQLASVAKPGGNVLTFAYDGSFQTGLTWTGAVAGSVTHALDADLRDGSQSVNGDNSISFTYDADGLLVKAGGLAITEDPQTGLPTATTLGNVIDSYTYNSFGEPVAYTVKFNGDSIYSNELTRNPLGRITRKVETLAAQALTSDYTYDAIDQLIASEESGRRNRYTYDVNGNRVSLTDQAGVTSGIYDAQDRLLQYGSAVYTYDASGNVLTRQENGQEAAFNYDEMGNLVHVSSSDGTESDYLIDGEGRRIGKRRNGILVQGFLYQDLLKPVAELDGNNNVISRFVYASRTKIPDYMIKNGVTYRIIADHLDSPRLVVNAVTGAVAQQIDYDEFGRVTVDTSPGFQPFGFTGGLYDADTG